MKKIIVVLTAVLSLAITSCGVGTYSVSSGNPDQSYIVFTADKTFDIEVTVDGQAYEMQTVKQKNWKKRRDIKNTAKQNMVVAPGSHKVKVSKDGTVVYENEIFVSPSEGKIIAL